jgi:SAM-dependent methyltransferase
VQATDQANSSQSPTAVDLRCHVCGGSQLRRMFAVPLSDGPYLHDKDKKRRKIYECAECGHVLAGSFDPLRYAEYYSALSDDYHCDHDADQSRYDQILGLLPKQSINRVLDIGCGKGTFLERFPLGVERFGIEPSNAAADCARAKGIQIVRYEDLDKPELKHTFDVVTAVDVIEHAADLQEFRRWLTMALRPGGTVILLTGDAGSTSARFLGRYWSYLNYAEHITFFGSRSMRAWLESDFQDIELTKTSHKPLRRECFSMVRAGLLFPVKLLVRRLLPVRYTVLYLPGDHMLVRATRKQPPTLETGIKN